MAAYSLLYAPITNPLVFTGELPFTNLTYDETLNSPGSITGEIPLDPYRSIATAAQPWTMDTFAEGKTVLWVAREGIPVAVGVLWGWDADLDADRLSFTCEGLHSALRKLPANSANYIDAEQTTILQDILTNADDGFIEGDLGPGPAIVPPTAATGITRTLLRPGYSPISCGQAIEELASLADGFDWRYRPFGTTDPTTWGVAFDMTYPPVGVDTGLVFTAGANIASISPHSDGKQITVFVRAYGNGTGSEAIVSQVFDSTLLDAGYPSYLTVTSNPEVADTTILDRLAQRSLTRSGAPVRMLDVAVYADATPGVTEYQVGDVVTVQVDRGFIQIDGLYRIVAKSVAVDENGTENVTMTLSPAALY